MTRLSKGVDRKVTISDLAGLREMALRFASVLKPGDVVLLCGEMGAGKTTFVRFVGEALHSRSQVNSPTFALIQRYDADIPMVHMDLYRLESEAEILSLDLDHYVSDLEGVIFVEWADKISDVWGGREVIALTLEGAESEQRQVQICVESVSESRRSEIIAVL